jgi:hypothetical protein
MKAIEEQNDRTNRSTQLTLLSAEELAEMQRPSAPRLREGEDEDSLRKADGSRKARPSERGAMQLRLPGF